MPSRRILLIQGHPDPAADKLCRTLARAYSDAAQAAGHRLRTVDLAWLDFPLLRSEADWRSGPVPPVLQPAQDGIAWAEHLVLFFPLWMGDMPALLKGFLEQVLRPGFAVADAAGDLPPQKKLSGRSARLVVTMGMPALAYRYYFRAHSVKALERNILGMVGIAPVSETLVGSVDELGLDGVRRWQRRMAALGANAE